MIIDFHNHIFPSFFRDERATFFPDEPAFRELYGSASSRLVGRRELIRHMDEAGVQKAVVFGFPWSKDAHFRRHNDYIIEAVQQHPDRLIGFCCFSPHSPEAAVEAQRCLESGLSGIGELALYGSDITAEDISGLKDVMEVGARFDVPVLFHCNEPVGHAYPGKAPMTLRQLYLLLKTYPDNKFVLAHWGGGIFFFGMMKKEVKEVLKKTWFDTAASPYLYSPNIYRTACEIIGEDRILLGSDYPLLSPMRYFQEMTAAGLPSRTIQRISGENAARLLRISDG